MRLLKNANNQSGVTIIALTVIAAMLSLLAGITLSIVLSDTSIIDKTNQDTAEYNEQIQNYKSEYTNLTQKVDKKENIVDTLPEEF